MNTLEKGSAASAGDGRSDAGDGLPRVLIVSDVRLYREGLAAALAGLGRVSIVGAVAGPDLTLACLSRLGPDAVLLDMALSRCLDLPAALRTEPPVRFVAFAVADVDDGIVACAESGISGYVGKDGSPEDLVLALEAALRGEVLCPPQVAGALFRRLAILTSTSSPSPSVSTLTRRELDIIELVDQGHSNKEIARDLRIGPATVKNHVHNILEKLHVHRRAEAAAMIRSINGARMHGRRPPPS